MMLRWPEHFQIRRAIFPVYTPKVSDFVIDFVIDHTRSNSILGAYFYFFFFNDLFPYDLTVHSSVLLC